MTDTKPHSDDHRARDRRNVKTAILLAVVAVAVYIGYFVFQAMA